MQRIPRRELVNVVPVVNQITTYRTLNPRFPKEKWNFATNLFGNVLLFLPFSVLLIAYGETNQKKILAAAFVVSASIEFTQLLLSLGVADVDDILLNVAGAYAGILLVNGFRVTRKALDQ